MSLRFSIAANEVAQTPADSSSFFKQLQEVSARLARDAAQREADQVFPQADYDALRASGLPGARVPPAHGGLGLSYVLLAEATIALARADSSLAQIFIPHHSAVERLVLMGTPEQKARYLGAIAHGAVVGSATAERGGTFRTDMSTRLATGADGHFLEGVKFYTTGARYAQYLRVTALDSAGNKVSVMLPRERQGIAVHDDWDGMGQRLTASGTIELHRVPVHADEIIPFSDWESTQRHYGSSATQMLHAGVSVGIALAVLGDAVEWAQRHARPVKESGVRRSVDDPFVQATVGRIAALAHGAQASVLAAARRIDDATAESGTASSDREQPLTIAAALATAEAKIIATEAALRSAELLYDIGGASATLRRHNLDRHWRNARTHSTHDPVSYKLKVLGDYHLNGNPPPVSAYY